MTLEQLARERGVLLSDKTTPCHAKSRFPGVSPSALSLLTRSPSKEGSSQCVIYLFGAEINTASFAMYTFSISVLIQALLIISMSGAADHGHYRKTFLLSFAFTGAMATMLFLPIVPQLYLLGALLAIVANTCIGASFVLLNSFLPLLVRHHPTVQEHRARFFESTGNDDEGIDTESSSLNNTTRASSEVQEDEGLFEDLVNSTSALLGSAPSGPDYTTPMPVSQGTSSKALALSTRISSYGMGIGYIAAVIVQSLSIFILVLMSKSSTLSLRVVLFVIGAWWFVFTIPTALWLRPRPGPPLNMDLSTNKQAFVAYLTYSWKSLGKTIRHARHLKDVVFFLGAWFLLSDGIATVGGTAILFAKTTLEMDNRAVAFISVIVTLSGVVGAFAWSRISLVFGLKPNQTILTCLFIFELIPLYGLLGFIPAVRNWGVLGLQQDWEMYPLGAIYGMALGGLSSYCRSLFGELIPPGYEAAFYALYAITDKGSSIFGPAIVGAITDATGEIRPVSCSRYHVGMFAKSKLTIARHSYFSRA
jgi:MFS transporter, UMF1 family